MIVSHRDTVNKMVNWNNHIMRKFGGAIRNNIFKAQSPFIKAVAISKCHRDVMRVLLKQDAEDRQLLKDLPDDAFFKS